MRYSFWNILLFFILFSCEIKLNQIPTPDNLIEKDKMVLVLEELMVMEQLVQQEIPSPQHYLQIAKKEGDTILKKHQVSFVDFENSMNYYGSRQQEMTEIYNLVLERIQSKMTKLN